MRGSCILLILHTASCILLHIPTSTRTRLPTCKSSALPEGVDGERGKGFMQDAAMAEEAWFVSARTRVSWSANGADTARAMGEAEVAEEACFVARA